MKYLIRDGRIIIPQNLALKIGVSLQHLANGVVPFNGTHAVVCKIEWHGITPTAIRFIGIRKMFRWYSHGMHEGVVSIAGKKHRAFLSTKEILITETGKVVTLPYFHLCEEI